MKPRWAAMTAGCVMLMGTGAGCMTMPEPRTIYEDPLTIVQLRQENKAGTDHSHPASIHVSMMSRILSGVRIRHNREAVFRLVTGDAELTPAFAAQDIKVLAPFLTEALAAAKPNEVVAFYRRTVDAGGNQGITSGGLFVVARHLFFYVANYKNTPTDGMNIAMTYSIDPVDNPLYALRMRQFTVTFAPEEAVVPFNEQFFTWEISNPGQVVVINLRKLPEEPAAAKPGESKPEPPASSKQPAAIPPSRK